MQGPSLDVIYDRYIIMCNQLNFLFKKKKIYIFISKLRGADLGEKEHNKLRAH